MSDESSSEGIGEEIPMHDQKAQITKASHSPIKTEAPPRRSPRITLAPKELTKTSSKRKLSTNDQAKASAKKLKSNVPTSLEESSYNALFIRDLLESAVVDANINDLNNLGLPEDVVKFAVKHFTELRNIMKKLNKFTSEKSALEKKRIEVKTDKEARTINSSIINITKAISTIRKEKIDWHSKMVLDISALCDRRLDEIAREADRARRRAREEKRQKAQA